MIFVVSANAFSMQQPPSRALHCDVLVVGGGTGGTAAGIQSARLGAKTIIVDSTPWLGGMLTAAGVSATDGNNRLPSGIWQQFRQAIWKRYGGPKAVATGWVSNTSFQPYVADSIFKAMATRVTTCVLLTGQAAGVLAWYCEYHHVEPRDVNIRAIQKKRLEDNAYLLPFIDVPPSDPNFKAIQRIGVTGIIRGVGVPYNGANQTWFYPEWPISQYQLVQGLRPYYPVLDSYDFASAQRLTVGALLKIFALTWNKIPLSEVRRDWPTFHFTVPFNSSLKLDRRIVAVLVDYYLHPFNRPVNFFGKLEPANVKWKRVLIESKQQLQTEPPSYGSIQRRKKIDEKIQYWFTKL